MKKEQAVFLLVGFAFGTLFGYALIHVASEQPDLSAGSSSEGISGPAGPAAPTQMPGAADAAAPMMGQVRELRRRVQENPDDHDALSRLANMYHDIQDFDQAIHYYTEALRVQPDDPDDLTDLGICYRAKQDYEEALRMFRRAREIDPQHWQSAFNIAIVAGFDLQQFDSAFEALEALEQSHPDLPQIGDLRTALERARSGATGG